MIEKLKEFWENLRNTCESYENRSKSLPPPVAKYQTHYIPTPVWNWHFHIYRFRGPTNIQVVVVVKKAPTILRSQMVEWLPSSFPIFFCESSPSKVNQLQMDILILENSCKWAFGIFNHPQKRQRRWKMWSGWHLNVEILAFKCFPSTNQILGKLYFSPFGC